MNRRVLWFVIFILLVGLVSFISFNVVKASNERQLTSLRAQKESKTKTLTDTKQKISEAEKQIAVLDQKKTESQNSAPVVAEAPKAESKPTTKQSATSTGSTAITQRNEQGYSTSFNTSNWTRYSHPDSGFSFKYPADILPSHPINNNCLDFTDTKYNNVGGITFCYESATGYDPNVTFNTDDEFESWLQTKRDAAVATGHSSSTSLAGRNGILTDTSYGLVRLKKPYFLSTFYVNYPRGSYPNEDDAKAAAQDKAFLNAVISTIQYN